MKWKTEFRGFLLFANNGTFLVTSALEEEVLPSRQWGSRRGCEWEVKGVQCQGEEGGQKALSLSHSKIWLFGAEPWFIPYGRERKKKANRVVDEKNPHQCPNTAAVVLFEYHTHSATKTPIMTSVPLYFFFCCFMHFHACIFVNIYNFKQYNFPTSILILVPTIIS